MKQMIEYAIIRDARPFEAGWRPVGLWLWEDQNIRVEFLPDNDEQEQSARELVKRLHLDDEHYDLFEYLVATMSPYRGQRVIVETKADQIIATALHDAIEKAKRA